MRVRNCACKPLRVFRVWLAFVYVRAHEAGNIYGHSCSMLRVSSSAHYLLFLFFLVRL
jgi:hypothetical protein